MSSSEDGVTGKTVLQSIPLVTAAEPAAMVRPRLRFAVPRIVDYMLVAAVIYFLL